MNNYVGNKRKRNQTLLIVEGSHEKNKLFRLIFKAFPELNIDMDNVWIYGTNIYILYDDIVNEYGFDWASDGSDIDLPFVISNKKKYENKKDKNDFTDIILVFDYERHDRNFSEEKILKMQSRFNDSTDMGKLYINYPMIESYQHIKSIPDNDYNGRKIPVSLNPGWRYKNLVSKETFVQTIFDFSESIERIITKFFLINDKAVVEKCCEKVLLISDKEGLDKYLDDELRIMAENYEFDKYKEQFKHWISKIGYLDLNINYWKYLRIVFAEIIIHNIRKGNYIQSDEYDIETKRLRECFNSINLTDILEKQNSSSKDELSGFI